MRKVDEEMTHSYRTGTWTGLQAATGLALLSPEFEVDTVRALWRAMTADDPLHRWLEALTAGGLAGLPPFALARLEDGQVRILVRGPVEARGDGTVVRAEQMSTWREHVGPAPERLSLRIPDDGGTRWPLTGGVVLAAEIEYDAASAEAIVPELSARQAQEGPGFLPGEPDPGGEAGGEPDTEPEVEAVSAATADSVHDDEEVPDSVDQQEPDSADQQEPDSVDQQAPEPEVAEPVRSEQEPAEPAQQARPAYATSEGGIIDSLPWDVPAMRADQQDTAESPEPPESDEPGGDEAQAAIEAPAATDTAEATAAAEPSAVEPSAVEPSAGEPAAGDPTAGDPTATDASGSADVAEDAVGHAVADEVDDAVGTDAAVDDADDAPADDAPADDAAGTGAAGDADAADTAGTDSAADHADAADAGDGGARADLTEVGTEVGLEEDVDATVIGPVTYAASAGDADAAGSDVPHGNLAQGDPDAAPSHPDPGPDDGDHDGHTVLVGHLQDAIHQGGDHPTGPDAGATTGEEPAAPVLAISTGQQVRLDRPALVGRAPETHRFEGPVAPHLVAVPSPEQDISRTHVEIAPEGGHVVITDLHSTNGTVITLPGSEPRRLHPGESIPVGEGTLVDLGDGIMIQIHTDHGRSGADDAPAEQPGQGYPVPGPHPTGQPGQGYPGQVSHGAAQPGYGYPPSPSPHASGYYGYGPAQGGGN